jgi:5,10-methylenetetrahydromethanopterin reductase
MAGLPRIAIRLDGALPPQECVRLAQAAEANHFSALWFAENPFARSVLPAAAACAALTRRLRIGVGVVNPFSRHPSLIAMEWGALDELAEGRAVLGIGAGIVAAVRRMGFGWERPLSAVRDAIHIVRGLLSGEEISYRGRVFSVDRVRLDYRPPRADLPIFMAAASVASLSAAKLPTGCSCPICSRQDIQPEPRRASTVLPQRQTGRHQKSCNTCPASPALTTTRRGASSSGRLRECCRLSGR